MAGAFVSASVGVLNPLLTKLSALVEGEYKLLKSVKKDIIFLRNELSSISVLLEHLSTKEDKLDGPTKEWRNNMLELAYDIEDCIDLFIHKLSCGDANANFVQKIGSKIKKLWGKHQITECIQELKNRVMEEDQRRKRNQIDDFISEPSVVEIDPRLPALYEEVERLVGIDGPREKIIKWIMTKGKPLEQRKVVSIVVGMYPEDYVIDRQELIWRWIAEGFIIEAKGKTREQVGENYFNELINRSLIQPVYIEYDGRASCCRVHDIVLDLIISLSTGQNFVTIVHEQQHWSSFKKIRRTWFPSNGTDNRIVKEITNNCSHVRSLFFDSPKPEQIPQFKKCHALRVLVLDGCMSLESQHINSLTYLFQLKYLKLNVANVTEMPKDIGRLQQLETLIIHGGGHVNEINIPSSVCRLQKLERLIVDYPMRLPDEIGFLQALEMLSLFYNIEYSIKCLQELRRLTRLRYLRIRTPFGGDVARFERYKDAFYMTLDELGKNSLQSLHVHVTTKFSDTLMDSCCSSAPGLRELSISGVGISKLSEQMVSLSNLAYLVIFYNTRSNDQKYINLLGCIPKLLYLKVIFPQGGEDGLTVGCGGFPCLKELMFRHSRLHWLLFEPGAMPKLQRLSIELFAQKAASNLGFEQSFVHLSSLQHLIVVLDCSDATTRDVKALEDAIRNVASIQTRCLTLEILRRYEDEMVKEDEEEQLKGSTEGGGTEEHHIQ
ncbi:hypothetical protein OsI_19007 [Oryza sativa Indica Group]|uniref:Uncharacterized protein n=1 Tax=Oryza sativa subsp. indica TaxID=39946 RepID=B8AZP9_ORYSI|nr:hypothetical protein OsI_19007 [Oryza sativa Indica Group]